MRIAMVVAVLTACGGSTPAPQPKVVEPVEPAQEAEPVEPPAAPQMVPQVEVNAQMISGQKAIVPADTTKVEIWRDGKARVVVTLKLCVDRAGVPSSVDVMKSTGYPMYDARLVAAMQDWRFRPFVVDGKPVAICTAYTFIYNQAPPPPPPP